MQAAVRYTPANQLGGDVYDFYRLENNRLGILVADVSGHGVNSAMLSGMVKALAAPLSIAVLEPGEMLAGLDVATEQYFPEGYFCTGFYLIADEETGLVRYAGVGHPPAIIVGPAGSRMLPSNPGMLGIGMVDGTAGDHDRLEPGESLIIYTDGLTDAMDPRTSSSARSGSGPCCRATTAPIPWRFSTGSTTRSTGTRCPARPRTTSTSSFSSDRPGELNAPHSARQHGRIIVDLQNA